MAASTKDHKVRRVDAHSGAVLRELGTGEILSREMSPDRRRPLLVLRDGGSLALVGAEGVLDRVPLPPGPAPCGGAVSPGGTRLAVWWDLPELASRAVVLEVPSGKQLLRLESAGPIHRLAFSPDGTRLAAACDDGRVRLWDAATGAAAPTLEGHSAGVFALAFHPKEAQLVSVAYDRTVRRWDLGSGRQLDERHGHSDDILCVAYSPDGRWFASGGKDHTLRFWRTDGSREAVVLRDDPGHVWQVAFSADGYSLAAISTLWNEARVWPAPARADLRVLHGHTNYVYPVACSPDGRLIASGGWDHVIRLWDAASGEPLGLLKARDMKIPFALAFGPDGRRLVSRSEDGKLHIWDTDTGENLATLPCVEMGLDWRGVVHGVVLTPDGRRVAAGAEAGVRRWDLAAAREVDPLPLPIRKVRVLAFRPDGGLLAAAGLGPDIVLVEPDTGRVRATLHHAPPGEQPPLQAVVQALAFSPDGRQLLSAGTDGVLRLWDVETGTLAWERAGHTGAVFAAVFHPDGKRIASGGRDRAIRVWDANRGDELVHLPGHTDYVFSLAFSPDGNTLVSGSGDATVRLWETVPLARRLEARRERAALAPEAERLVDRLLREEGLAAKVAERLRTEPGLSESLRRAAGLALLHRGLLPPP